jgi:Domain of unknown function (DUF4189)
LSVRPRSALVALAGALVLLFAVPALAQASWGSIAINPETGKVGISSGKSSAQAAKRAAKNRCGNRHCKSALWVFNGWGAVVKKKSGVYISGIGRTKAKAFANARKRAGERAPAYASVFSGFS